MRNIIVATIKEWNISNYFMLKELFKEKYNFHLIRTKDELRDSYISDLNPKYIFFPHWSWIIEKSIYENYNCVVFHMTDLPFGRGGSPLQNLIIRGIKNTKISALKVEEGMDSGDIYLKEEFNISDGSAEQNYVELSNIIFNKMIPVFLNNKLTASKQEGKVTVFNRRKPEQSNLNTLDQKSIDTLYDFIRMLDADGYPKAYLEFENVRIEFSGVDKKGKKLVGKFEVIENE